MTAFVLLFPLAFFGLVLYLFYLFVNSVRLAYRAAFGTWFVGFFVEIACLTFCTGPVIVQLGLPKLGFQPAEGANYLMTFLLQPTVIVSAILRGKGFDFLLLLLSPLLPALVAFWISSWRGRLRP